MKQRITIDQLQELTPEQQEKLRELWQPQYRETFLLNGKRIWTTERNVKVKTVVRANLSRYKVLQHGGNTLLLDNCLPLLSIGQLLQLLEDSGRFEGLHKSDTDVEYKVYVAQNDSHGRNEYIKSDSELVNALWQAVKETTLHIDTEEEMAEKAKQERLAYIRHCQKCFKVFSLKDYDFSGGKKCPHCGAEF